MAKLTDKQKAFVNHYLICLNATEAAKRAGYKGSYDTLRSIGSENLTKPNIREVLGKRMSKLEMSAEETVKRISDIAAGDMLKYIDSQGNLDLQAMRDDDAGRLLKKYKKTKRIIPRKNDEPIEVERIEIELYGADAALDKLMRYYGKYNDKVVHEWREEAKKAGIPPNLADEIFERDVEQMLAIMTGKESDSN
ncbi:MAG: terminase small subunit [Chromatiaceae bacterium]|nr:terminase small subunit [Chromatiaceae bacterium]